MSRLAPFKLLALPLLGFVLTGCATTQNQKDPLEFAQQDPYESGNRAVFKFNEMVDNNVLEPVARGYKAAVPGPIRSMVGNIRSNFDDIGVTVNSLLQLKFANAASSGGRMVVNSTFGLGGIIDLASDIGLEKRNEDFGQTMGYYGVPSGPYVMLPFFGPSTLRDVGGLVLDSAFDPIFVGSFFVAPFIGPVVGATRVADQRAVLLDTDKTLEEAALDKYEFLRDAYLQRRRSLVFDGNPPRRKADEDLLSESKVQGPSTSNVTVVERLPENSR
ncbi:MAG: VacJ family lipoprotein [Pseudomonadota bacterium]